MFSYLYNTISSEIKSGKYPYGEKLPSYKQVCDIYEVGIRTVKDVFAALHKDGYIKTEERRRAVVAYRQEKRADEANIKELLERKDAIVDSIYAVKPLLCDVVVQSMTVNSSFELAQCRRIIRGISGKPIYERWRAVSNTLKKLMMNFNNPMLIDMYADFDAYINISSFEGFDNPYDLICDDIERVFTGFLNDYEKGNEEYVKKCITNVMDRKGAEIEKYLEKLAGEYPQYAKLPQKEFEWQPEKRRTYAHAEIARNIICDLTADKFDLTSKMLPSMAALAKRYGVSTYTVKEALCALEWLGLVEIVNGVGTRVTINKVASHAKNLNSSILKSDCLSLAYGIQFLALTGRCAAKLAFDNIDAKKMLKDGNAIDYKNVVIPSLLLRYIIENQPNHTLKTIFGGIFKTLNWGYYFHYLLDDTRNKKVLNHLSRRAFELPAQGSRKEFADNFGDMWIYVLTRYSAYIATLGLEEAEKIYIPQYHALGYTDIHSPEYY